MLEAVTAPASHSLSPVASQGSGCRRVLVIDDSALICEAAKIALETVAGWHVSTAMSGEEGLALAASERPNVILLDVVMPGMDGVATAERFRMTPSLRTLPIVMLTAQDHPEELERLKRTSARGVIAKPFEIANLSRQLDNLLGWTAT